MHMSGKITTVPRLFSEHSLQNENKHQIMNVHTKCTANVSVVHHFMNETQQLLNWKL